MPTLVAALLWSLLWLGSVFGPTGDAGAATLFPPTTYARTTGEPNVFAATFPCRPGHAARLVVENGPGGAVAATSARVALNAVEVIRERDFQPASRRIEAPVTLQARTRWPSGSPASPAA